MGYKRKKIKNLDQLDTEIYRQKFRAKELELQLDKQWDHLHDHFLSMTAHSMFNKRGGSAGFWQALLSTDGVQNILQRLSAHLADKTAQGLESFLSRFSKPKE